MKKLSKVNDIVTSRLKMKKEHIAIVVLSVLLVIISTAWILSMLQSKHWVVAGSWTAYEPALEQNYNMTTNHFSISGEQWRISYSCSDYNFPDSYWDIKIFNATNGNETD